MGLELGPSYLKKTNDHSARHHGTYNIATTKLTSSSFLTEIWTKFLVDMETLFDLIGALIIGLFSLFSRVLSK